MRWIILALIFVAASSHAQATEIQVLDENYSTTITTFYSERDCRDCEPTTLTSVVQQATSATPFESAYQLREGIYASATADRFSVSASAYAFVPCQFCVPSSHATVESSLSFRALQDSTALLTLDGFITSFTSGFFSLFDQTTGASLFSEDFRFPVYVGVFSPVAFNASLDANHIYELTLRGDSGANFDAWSMQLNVSGLYAIAAPAPEPETWAMLLAGLIGVGFAAHRRVLA